PDPCRLVRQGWGKGPGTGVLGKPSRLSSQVVVKQNGRQSFTVDPGRVFDSRGRGIATYALWAVVGLPGRGPCQLPRGNDGGRAEVGRGPRVREACRYRPAHSVDHFACCRISFAAAALSRPACLS